MGLILDFYTYFEWLDWMGFYNGNKVRNNIEEYFIPNYIIQLQNNQLLNRHDKNKIEQWLINNCKKKAMRYAGGTILFEDLNDVLLFKLAWG